MLHSTTSSPAAASKPKIPHFPFELFYIIREHLIDDHRLATAAKFMDCSKTLYDLFLPVLDNATLVVNKHTADKVFWGLSGRE